LRDSPLWKKQNFVTEFTASLLNDIFNYQEIQSIPDKFGKDEHVYFKNPRFEEEIASSESNSRQEIKRYILTLNIRSNDFSNFAEAALEETITDLMREIENGEFECTLYPKLVTNL
jgi:hypothetical protein